MSSNQMTGPTAPLELEWAIRIDLGEGIDWIAANVWLDGDGRVVSTWIMGNDYRVRSGYYNGYPA